MVGEEGRVYEIVGGFYRWLVNPPLQFFLIRLTVGILYDGFPNTQITYKNERLSS